MLASTVQFSSYGRSRPLPAPAPREAEWFIRRGRSDVPIVMIGPRSRLAPVPSGPNSVPTFRPAHRVPLPEEVLGCWCL